MESRASLMRSTVRRIRSQRRNSFLHLAFFLIPSLALKFYSESIFSTPLKKFMISMSPGLSWSWLLRSYSCKCTFYTIPKSSTLKNLFTGFFSWQKLFGAERTKNVQVVFVAVDNEYLTVKWFVARLPRSNLCAFR